MTSDLPFRVLLNWAVDYVAEDIRVRRYSESDCFGNIPDEDNALEIRDAERWLADAREALK